MKIRVLGRWPQPTFDPPILSDDYLIGSDGWQQLDRL
jgi:hypothetical protein